MVRGKAKKINKFIKAKTKNLGTLSGPHSKTYALQKFIVYALSLGIWILG